MEPLLVPIHRARLTALFAAVAAWVLGPGLTLTDLARRLPGSGALRHKLKRIDRLAGNAHLQREAGVVYGALCRVLLAGLTEAVIVVDWSDLKADQSLHLLRASLPASARSKKANNAARSAKEPWLLVASPTLAARGAKRLVGMYRQRMQIEEAFRDMKSQHFGEGLERSRSRSAGRYTLLVLIASLAAFVLWLVGTATTERNLDQHPRPGSRKRSPYSRPFLARMLLTLEDYRPLLDGLS
ncbi:MAG: transposase, partial [Thiohalocapsa sp.]|uniref:transposase n=1 Tax=Thiohalocapsa sp. TaxID=2497641 RepID=UPI0025F0C54B